MRDQLRVRATNQMMIDSIIIRALFVHKIHSSSNGRTKSCSKGGSRSRMTGIKYTVVTSERGQEELFVPLHIHLHNSE